MGLVGSARNVMAYGFGVNEPFVNQCVQSGIGDQANCTALSQRVGLVACADLGTRGAIGMLGVVHGVQGLQNFFAVRNEKTFRDRTFQLIKSAIYLGVSAVEISVAFFFPAVTVNSRGQLTMGG